MNQLNLNQWTRRLANLVTVSAALSLVLPLEGMISALSSSDAGVIQGLSEASWVTDAHAQRNKRKRRNARANGQNRPGRRGARRLDRKMLENPYGLIGIRAHMNFANLSVSKDKDPFLDDPSRGFGFGFGITADKAFNRIFGVRLDVLYQNKNFSAQGKPNFNLGDSKTRNTSMYLDYLEVPLMMVIRFMDNRRIRPYALFGAYAAMLLSTQGEQEEEGALDDPRRPFSTFDAGLVFGAGSYFVLPPGMGFLSAELRYTQGSVNVADTGVEAEMGEMTANNTPLSRQSYINNNLMLMVGYYF